MSKRFKLFWAGLVLIIFGVLIISWLTPAGVLAILLGLFVVEPLAYMPMDVDWTWPQIFLGLLVCVATSVAFGFLVRLIF